MFIIKIPLQFLKCIGGSDDLWSFVRFGNYMWQQWYRLRLPLASATVECTSAVRWTISPLIEGRAFFKSDVSALVFFCTSEKCQ